MVPDEVFDDLMADLTGAELKVLLYVIRRTFGFKKSVDMISLRQMVDGITTKEGRVLDRGTGLSKPSVIGAVRALVERNVLIAEARTSAIRGFEPTSYHLNVLPETAAAPLSINMTSPRKETLPALVKEHDQQQTVTQDTDEHTVVVAALRAFGLTSLTAHKLATTYPADYVLRKVDLAQWLVRSQSRLVAKNPAGYLRKAIEEDYLPPTSYKTPEERDAADRRTASIEARQRAAELETARARETARLHLQEQYPPLPIPEVGLTTRAAWEGVLERLRDVVTEENYDTWLVGTALLECDGKTATIAAPSDHHVEWLRRRFDAHIARALTSVLDRTVARDYVKIEQDARVG
jgi:hypothetical protein